MQRGGVLALVGLLLVGCATTTQYGGKSANLSLGMSKRQVQDVLGAPQDIMIQNLSGAMVETWGYLDRNITFKNGILQSWALVAPPSSSQ
jgi:hypothetical protein